MARPKKEEAESGNGGVSSNDLLSSFMDEHKDDHFNDKQPKHIRISSGSLLLDSSVKVSTGSILRISAKGAEMGKTSQSLVYGYNFLKTVPKSKILFVKAEARLSEDLQKRSGMKFVSNPKDWDYGTVFVFACNIFETVASLLEKLIKQFADNGEYLCVIIDSLDGLILKGDADKDLFGSEGESSKVAGVPLMTKLLFRRIGLPVVHNDVLLIITSQYSANIKLNPYSKEPGRQVESSGGSSIMHMADNVLSGCERYQSDLILEKEKEKPDPIKNKILGVYSTWEVKKSTSDQSGTKIRVPIKKNVIGPAIWVSKEIVDMALMWDMIERKGGWYYFEKSFLEEARLANLEIPEKIQGMDAVYSFIENNKPISDYIFNKFQNLLSEN